MKFPLPFVPKKTYKGGNGFGASRDKVREGLVHAANDLAARAGTPVLAMDQGVVLLGPSFFYNGTYVLDVKHPQFIARYGEIGRIAEVKPGDIKRRPGYRVCWESARAGHVASRVFHRKIAW